MCMAVCVCGGGGGGGKGEGQIHTTRRSVDSPAMHGRRCDAVIAAP